MNTLNLKLRTTYQVTINKMNSQPQTGRKYAQNIDLNKRLANKIAKEFKKTLHEGRYTIDP